MNAKKYLVTAIVLSIVLLTLAASFFQTKRSANKLSEPSQTALTGPAGKFGRVIETVLPAAKTNGATDILNLETGHALTQPPLDLNSRADLIMAGIRSNGLDLSCSVWPSGAACVTYDMAIVAVETKSWEATTAEELLGNPLLALGQHSPRRLLLLRTNSPNTYLFRTGEGTLGMLQIEGLSQSGQGMNICYKLINPANSSSLSKL